VVEKMDGGKYRVPPSFGDLGLGEFVKIFNRASKTDSTRQRDLSDITRLKQNNDIMRGKLLAAIAERDHYLAALQRHNIDPGPLPAAAGAAPAVPAQSAEGSEASAADEQAEEHAGEHEGGQSGQARSPNDPPTGLA
jgi:hypothetical protein